MDNPSKKTASSRPSFAVGDRVQWTSQSAGRRTTKVGTVEKVVRVFEDVQQITQELSSPGFPRPHTSYLVRVPAKTSRGRGKLYWPIVNKLSKLEAALSTKLGHP